MRISRTHIAVAAISVGILLLPIILHIPNPYGNPVIKEVHETSHTVLFFFAQLALMVIVKKRRPEWRLASIMLGTALLTACLGGAIELVQPFVNRSRSWNDFGRDLWGIIAASGLYYGWRLRRRAALIKGAAITVSLLALVLAFTPLLSEMRKQWLRDRAFPMLMDFETPALRQKIGRTEYGRIKFGPAPEGWTGNRSQVVEVTMPKATRWSGFTHYHPVPNWKGFRQLTFEVFSPDEKPTRIALNIYSPESGDKVLRYHAFDIHQGENQLTVDLTTAPLLEGHHINRLLWYSISPERDVTLYFDNIRLQ